MANEGLGKDIEQIRDELKQLRDEIRVRLHLGAMDARDAFANIEREIDHVGRDITAATQRTLVKARNELRELRTAFKAQEPLGKGPPQA